MSEKNHIQIKHLGLRDYGEVWNEMKSFTASRAETTPDELWIVEHSPVFTLGLAGKEEHLLNPGNIPITQSDRGGQVTYHGPGQLIVYIMLDLHRAGLGVRSLVDLLQNSIIQLLQQYNVEGHTIPKAPGVYVSGSKLAAIGLRIRNGRSFHGISLNVEMDLEPFSRINPCGYPDMQITQLHDIGVKLSLDQAAQILTDNLQNNLSHHTNAS